MAKTAGISKKGRAPKAPKKVPFGKQPYDPLSVPYKTNADFTKAVNTFAQSQVAPQLSGISEQRSREGGAHTGRLQDIGSMYDWYGGQLKDAFDQGRTALNDLITRNATGGEEAAKALGGALNANRTADAAQSSIIGGQAPQNVPDPQVVGSAGNFMPQMLGSYESGMSRDIGLAGLGRIAATDTEGRRNQGVLTDLGNQERDVRATIPGLISQARETLGQSAREAQNQGFTQRMAGQEFGLKAQNQGFTQNLAGKEFGLKVRQQKHQESVDAANIKLQGDQLKASIASQQVGGDQQGAQLKAQAIDNGVQALNSYLAPGKNEWSGQGKVPAKQRAKGVVPKQPRDPMKAWRILRTQIGLDVPTALKLIHSVTDEPGFHDFDPRKYRKAVKEGNRAANTVANIFK